MTIATRSNDRWTSDSVSEDRTDHTAGGTRPTASMTGWYDPDGAAWEPDTAADFEALRATAPRGPAGIRVSGDPLER